MRFFNRRRGDRGAVAVEFALTVPLLLTFLLGTVELGLYMKDYVSMSSSVRAGARTASAAAGAGPAMCGTVASPFVCSPRRPTFAQAAADTMQTAGMAMNADDVQWIMVYLADTTGNVPASCTSNCVKYAWNAASNKFVYSSGVWDSSMVNACLNDAGRMSVGVAMQARHNWMTGLVGGLMGGDKTMVERTVMQFEPLEQNTCKPDTTNPHP